MLASSGITEASAFQWSSLTKVLRTDDIVVDVEVDVGGKRKRAAWTSELPRLIFMQSFLWGSSVRHKSLLSGPNLATFLPIKNTLGQICATYKGCPHTYPLNYLPGNLRVRILTANSRSRASKQVLGRQQCLLIDVEKG